MDFMEAVADYYFYRMFAKNDLCLGNKYIYSHSLE